MSNYITVREAVQMMIDDKIANMTFVGLNTENIMKHLELDCKSRLARLAEVGKGTGVKGNAVKYRFSRDGYDPDKIRINITDEDTQRPLWSLFIMLSSFATEETPLVEVEKEVKHSQKVMYMNTTTLKGTQIMTKMLLTIISCVFLCAACSEDDNNYYDELYNRVITVENEIFDLQTQFEENNTAESDAEEINTTDVVTGCSYDNYSDTSEAFTMPVRLYAQLDDVLKWNNTSKDHCKNASISCTQRITVIADGARRSCSAWYCTDKECTATTHATAYDCNADTIAIISHFYSTTHSTCVYKIEELLN